MQGCPRFDDYILQMQLRRGIEVIELQLQIANGGISGISGISCVCWISGISCIWALGPGPGLDTGHTGYMAGYTTICNL